MDIVATKQRESDSNVQAEINVTNNNRIDWIDALKFLGIFLIYIAHFADTSGKICLYAYAFHVPLFFLVSGLFAFKHKDMPFWKYVVNKIKTLLLPYFVFGLLTAGVLTLQANQLPVSFSEIILDLLMGMRNQMFVTPLWFFPCLFLVEIFFEAILKIARKKYFVFAICVILFFIAEKFFYQGYVVLPRWWFSADTAFYYLLYYAIGAISFNAVAGFSFSKEKLWKKICACVLLLISAAVAFLLFFEKISPIHSFLMRLPMGESFYEVFVALALIFLHIFIAMQIAKIPLVCEIGRNTLWLCGNELMIKTIFPAVLSTFGLSYYIGTPAHTVIYCFALLLIAVKLVIPIEKILLGNLFAGIKKH